MKKIFILFSLALTIFSAYYFLSDWYSQRQELTYPDITAAEQKAATTEKPFETIAEREEESKILAEIETEIEAEIKSVEEYYILETGKTVLDRILMPEGFKRVELKEGSFGEYLRTLPLKPHGSKVLHYNGETKPWDVHEAVIDIDVGTRDLQQCADSVIRLRAEYLYGKGLFDRIHFNFTNGFNAEYEKWMAGNRIRVTGNKAVWVSQGSAGSDYTGFRKYLDMVFSYAGTLSLSKEMIQVPVEEMQPGDVFLKGATPGHCVIVLDMAKNEDTGKKIFIAAQGYMPAQEMHILKNPANQDGNPWYRLDFGSELDTPEWRFTHDQLYRFTN